MQGQEIYESLEAAMDCLKAYNCQYDGTVYSGTWLEAAIGWMQQALEEARIEKASLAIPKKEAVA